MTLLLLLACFVAAAALCYAAVLHCVAVSLVRKNTGLCLDNLKLRGVVRALAERVAAQGELLSRRAEARPGEDETAAADWNWEGCPHGD